MTKQIRSAAAQASEGQPSGGARVPPGPKQIDSAVYRETVPGAVARVETTSFAAGAVVANRYGIVRFIGCGGMGEVYEADDLDLRRRVALKTLRPETALNAGAISRFKREIQHSLAVTHPNVCRVYDIGHHSAGDGTEVAFLTMEFLKGETLSERLRRSGRLSTSEAMPLVAQMVGALQAAHEAGIVHRDFSSANVMLVEAGSGGVRAVVTDFGLARAYAGDALASLQTGGAIVGTPAYMAPEQVQGEEVTPAADLYALGVVLYEMVTGSLPFTGETPLSVAAKRLKEKPVPPRQHVPDLDPRWERVILRCLEQTPTDRFASARDVARALAGEPGKRRGMMVAWQRLVVAGLAAALLTTLAYRWPAYRAKRAPTPPPVMEAPAESVKVRRSLAVLGFRNLAGRPDRGWISTALMEMLTTELALGEKLRTIPGESIARAKVDLLLPDGESLATETLERLRGYLASDYVVVGSYLALGSETGGQIRLDLLLQETTGGEVLTAVSEKGTEVQLDDLVRRAGAALRAKLDLGEVSAAEAAASKASLPASPEGARLYAEGLQKLRAFDRLSARHLLAKAVAADPGSSLAHAALAEAYSGLGYDVKAREEAKKAVELSDGLTREEKLWTEGRYREIGNEWEKAIETYKALWAFFPDNLDYGLRLAAAQVSGGKGKDALGTVEALRGLPPPYRDDARIDLAESKAAGSVADLKRQQSAASSAARKGAVSRLLVAEARLQEANASLELGERDRAKTAASEAKRLFEAAGDRRAAAKSLNVIAHLFRRQGKYQEARQAFEQALEIRRAIGDRGGVGTELMSIAKVLPDEGEFEESRRRFEQALAIFNEVGDKRSEAVALDSLANLLDILGDSAAARHRGEASLALAREIGNKMLASAALGTLGEILFNQGDLSAARTRGEEALTLSREVGTQRIAAYVLVVTLGRVAAAEGDFEEARERYENGRGLWTEMNNLPLAANADRLLAALLIEEGRPAEAETQARKAADVLHEAGLINFEVGARVVLVEALLAQGKRAQAQQVVAGAQALLKYSSPKPRMRLAISAACVRAASGGTTDAADAASSLKAALTEAAGVPLFFDALLALGEIEIKAGKADAGRARLLALEKDATARGFKLIARKARRAAS